MALDNSRELGTAVAEHPKGGFPAFRTDTFAVQIVWLAISFGLLYWLMSTKALPRLRSVLDDRRDRIAADLDAAARAQGESEAAVSAYEDGLKTARANANALAKEAQDRSAAEAAERRRVLEADLATKLEAAERSVAERKTAAMSNVRAIATDATKAIVERLTGRAPDGAVVEAAASQVAAG